MTSAKVFSQTLIHDLYTLELDSYNSYFLETNPMYRRKSYNLIKISYTPSIFYIYIYICVCVCVCV